jgi:murein DD-endopeptidase MepM/ murein hydrolase activator NlpD
MHRSTLVALALVAAVATTAVDGGSAARAAGTWAWPVRGPVIRAFDPPESPYGAGHRGIDVAAPAGSVAVAPADGRVSFAGPVGGRLFVTIDHGGGLESTLSFVSSLDVRRGDDVSRGQPIARTGGGHTGDSQPNLHLGVRLDDVYVDPLAYLAAPDLSDMIRLAPLLD